MTATLKDATEEYTFRKRYATPCPSCNQQVHTDTPAERDADGNYVHIECPVDLDELTAQYAGKAVCDQCWLVGPCDCES